MLVETNCSNAQRTSVSNNLHRVEIREQYPIQMVTILFFMFEGEKVRIEPSIQFFRIQHPQVMLKHLYAGHYHNLTLSSFFIHLLRNRNQTNLDGQRFPNSFGERLSSVRRSKRNNCNRNICAFYFSGILDSLLAAAMIAGLLNSLLVAAMTAD